jgi:hypothetical protein
MAKTRARIKTSIGVGITISGRRRGPDAGGQSQPQPYRLALPWASRARPRRDRPGPTATAPRRDRATHHDASLSTSHWGRHSDIAQRREVQLNCALDSGADLRQHCREPATGPTLLQISCYTPAWPHGVGSKLKPSCSRPRYEEPFGWIIAAFEDSNNNMTSSCQARRAGRMTAKAISAEMINGGASFLFIGF